MAAVNLSRSVSGSTSAGVRPEALGSVRRSPVLVAAPLLVLGLLLAIVLRYSALDLDNQDTWFHLALGDRFLGPWGLGDPGALTSFATSSWVPTQWSTEVLAAGTEHVFGLPGVAWLFGALMLAFVLTVYVTCRRVSTAPVSAVMTAFVVFAAAPALSARPQVISLILLAVTVRAWMRSAEDGRPRWWLVPLTWVWATAHGLWSAGVLVGLVCCVGILLERRVDSRRSGLLFVVPLLSVVAAAVTPVGPRLLTAQLAVSARTSLIAEWGPTSFREVPALAAALMVAWLVMLWARRGGVPWVHLLLLLLACGWILLVTRMVAPGAVIVAPLLAQALQARVPVTEVTKSAARVERWGIGLMAVAYLVALGLAVPHTAAVAEGVPTGFATRLQQLPAGSAVLVEDGVGGWMEWQFPGVDPTIDGMLDAYPVGYIRDFFDMTDLKPGWRAFVERSDARVAVLQHGSPLSAAMQQQLGWRVVQHDGTWVYLVPPSP